MTVRSEIEPGVRARIVELGRLLKQRRETTGLSLRAAADETGVPFNTLARVENGLAADLVNTLAILAWLDIPTTWLTGDAGTGGFGEYQRGWDECAAAVRGFLDKTSTATDAGMMVV